MQGTRFLPRFLHGESILYQLARIHIFMFGTTMVMENRLSHNQSLLGRSNASQLMPPLL